MTWAIYQVREGTARGWGLTRVRAESADEALDKFMDIQRQGFKRHGVAPERRSKFLAIPCKIDHNEEH